MKIKKSLRERTTIIALLFFSAQIVSGQSDSIKITNWTGHFQATIIGQKHSGFQSPYKGENSLADSVEPTAVSLTSTLFIGRRLWKGAAIYVDPEIAGGKG